MMMSQCNLTAVAHGQYAQRPSSIAHHPLQVVQQHTYSSTTKLPASLVLTPVPQLLWLVSARLCHSV